MKTSLLVLILIIAAIVLSFFLGYSTANLEHDVYVQEIVINLREECNAGQIGGIDCQVWAEGFLPDTP